MLRQVQLLLTATLIGSAMATVPLARASEPSPPSKIADARIVNITSDSAPGWSPSTDQARAASDAVLAYFTARDSGRVEAAYGMLESGNSALQPLAAFSRDLLSFNKQAGAVVKRRIVNVTWTKDPAQAPEPGVYAAIDVLSRFANIDRDCGYIVVYQAPKGGPFLVTREEANFISNADAATITRRQSKAAMESVWLKLSRNCPNYPGESPAYSPAPLPEQPTDSIGYKTVASALLNLRSRPGVTLKSENGFTIATDDVSKTIWVFTSEGQPAYPAAIKRQFLTDKNGGTSLEMSVLCESSKTDCDNLVRTFEALNARMTSELNGRR